MLFIFRLRVSTKTVSKGITLKPWLKPIVGEAPMFDRLEILRMAHGLASHASARQTEIARNVANADTPGFRARDVQPFADTYEATAPALRATRPGHLETASHAIAPPKAFDAGGPTAPNGNTVSLEAEMVKAAEVKQSHDLALAVYQTSLGILRTSLGRAR